MKEVTSPCNGKWCDLLGIMCWVIWKRRNEILHHNVTSSISECVTEANGVKRCMARTTSNRLHGKANNQTPIAEPEYEGIEVHVDGSFSTISGAVGCGGFLSKANGTIIESFLCHLEGGDSLVAEIWGCIWGLRRAWDNGLRQARLFTDSKVVVALSREDDVELHIDADLIVLMQNMLRRDWNVQLKHINRDDNRVTDSLAKLALSARFGLQVFSGETTRNMLTEMGLT